MGRVWSEENKFQKWLDVELAATETLADAGIVPKAAARKLRERARIDVAKINEVEAKVRHDVIAFTIVVQESVGDPETARWLHYGLTSNDVVDTAPVSYTHLDVYKRQILTGAGIPARQISSSGYCTACRTDLLFSYRRERTTGRMMAAIGIR